MCDVPTATPLTFRSSGRSSASPSTESTSPPPPQAPLTQAERAVISGAERALLDERRLLNGDELAGLAGLPDGAVMALASLAHQVRLEWCGPEVEIEGILSAKTGGCPEDCHFCSQSSRFDTPVKATPFLAEGGVHRYNHNVETARSFFPSVVTTHTWDERAETCRLVKDNGMELCCGALIGMGETDAQRVELLVQLQDLEPTEVPINFLNPRPGTPLADRPVVGAWEAVRWIALFRLALPSVILRYAGGREVTLRDLQAIGMTAGINALIVGNYLTTLGRSADEDLQMLEDLRMPIGALTAVI